MAAAMRRAQLARQRPAFTLVELLVVIVVIGVLLSMVGLAGVQVLRLQKVTATKAIMRGTQMAIDQFAEENPLRYTYDTKTNRSFGPYPPYAVAGYPRAGKISGLLDPNGPIDLSLRFQDDFAIGSGYVVNIDEDDENDDIRSLWTYLQVYVPGATAQIPESAKEAIRPRPPENQPNKRQALDDDAYVDTSRGAGGAEARTPILGIHDAWGVPLDYFFYVKVEFGVRPDGSLGWRITDRVPVLRSRGVSRDVYDLHADTQDDWIFSSELPAPVSTAVDPRAGFVAGNAAGNGWAQVPAYGDIYIRQDHPERWFGFVPTDN